MDGAASKASFFARNAHAIKSTTTPTLAISETSKPKEESKSRVLNRMSTTTVLVATVSDRHVGATNSNNMPSTPKQTDWADSDDDADFYAAFTATEDPRVSTLKNKVALKESRIEELEATVETKDIRIAQLEGFVEEKVGQLVGLEAEVEEKDARIEELKNDNHTQHLYVQELVAEVDEKARRIEQLEGELDMKAARIHELELESMSDTQASTEDLDTPNTTVADKSESPATVPDHVPAKYETADAEPTVDAKPTLSEELIVSFVDEASPDPAEKDMSGPAVNESKFPQLWSPDAPRKVLPPVEKPKILKMAIDMSKYDKKASVKMPQVAVASNARGAQTSTWGQAGRQHRTKTAAVPKIEPHKDIRHMPHMERAIFANGPDVTVTMGRTKLATLPKYILMQCSEKANNYFVGHPDATTFDLPTGCMDSDAAKAHLQWMDEMTYQGRVYSITLNADEKFDERNLRICQAARVLGMNNTYVGHFTKILCDRVRSNRSSLEFMSMICEVAYPENDPIFDCLANNLFNQQLSKALRVPAELEQLQAKYPVLKEKMDNIGQRVKNNRAAEKRKGKSSRDASRDGEGTRSRYDGKKTP
jgi:hypothetical protein